MLGVGELRHDPTDRERDRQHRESGSPPRELGPLVGEVGTHKRLPRLALGARLGHRANATRTHGLGLTYTRVWLTPKALRLSPATFRGGVVGSTPGFGPGSEGSNPSPGAKPAPPPSAPRSQPHRPVARGVADGVRDGLPGLLLDVRRMRVDHRADRGRDLLDEGRELLGRLPLEGDVGPLDLDVGKAAALEQPAERVRCRSRQRARGSGRWRRDVEALHRGPHRDRQERHLIGRAPRGDRHPGPRLEEPAHTGRRALAVGVEDDPPARQRRVEAVRREVEVDRGADSTNSMLSIPAARARSRP